MSSGGNKTVRLISIVIPMRNEARRIEERMEQIAAQDVAVNVEILVGDGVSDDDSVALLHEAAERLGLNVKVITNPGRAASSGLNVCIRQATGDLIVRMDCHARYPTDYLTSCIRASEETGADNVGGPTLTEGQTPSERAVACAMDSPFGGIGWSKIVGDEPVEHDTVYCGAFRPSAFEKAGLFDERFKLNEDEEFNLRLRRAGGRVVLDPRIRIWYTPRSTLRGVFSQYYGYGVSKPPLMAKHLRIASVRSLVPAVFVFSIAALGAAAVWSTWARWALAVELLVYVALALATAGAAVRGRRESAKLLPRVAATFPAFHLGYGLGMLRGLTGVVSSLRARRHDTRLATSLSGDSGAHPSG